MTVQGFNARNLVWAFASALLVLSVACCSAAEWLRAGANTNALVWGVPGGLQFAIAPAGFREREPRGLIRLGYPILSNGVYDLVNFIAVEPVVEGRKGFSELEMSKLDEVRGKRFWVDPPDSDKPHALNPGTIRKLNDGVEELSVTLRVEKFDTGAHVRVVLAQRSDTPDELRLTVHAEPGSAPMEYCILTATMGNMARTRELWLKDEVVASHQLYPDYRSNAFTVHTHCGLDRLQRTSGGDVLVAVTTDEADPASVFPFPGTRRWHYSGFKVTQFWKKPSETARDDLQAIVNARFTYWQSVRPIPGGISFENFELRERFYDGQQFIFGITRRTPEELGFKSRPRKP